MIVVDQLEELFTLAGAAERGEFLAALRALRALPACAIVLTLRADFYGALMESPLWAERKVRLSRIDVAPLRGDELRDAISQPARDVGVEVDPALLERLLSDAADEPGILPLLQETMVQLWEIRAEQRLTLADYEALGDGHRSGLAVALPRRADATLRALEPAREQIARRIMLRLVHFGEGRADTRRQQPRSALRGADDDPAELDRVLGRLIADRLLTADDDEQTSDGRVDLAHEVMITAWPKLAAWIWDAATGNPIGIPLAHHGDVVSAAFSPDGTRVVTASDDRTARIWETGLDKTPPEDWPALAARSPFVLINGVHVLRSSLALTAGEPR